MKATVIKRLNKRNYPSSEGNLPLPNPLEPGDIIDVVEEVKGTSIGNPPNNTWYKTSLGYFVWSGGVTSKVSANILFKSKELREYNRWIDFFKIDEIWKRNTGLGVNVAILDSGVNANHPDIKESLGEKWNFLDNSTNVEDEDGHGTHCAGIIAGRGLERIFGVAPGVRLNIGKIFKTRYSGINHNILIQALNWAINNSNIITISSGYFVENPEATSIIKNACNNGKIFICAIGNNLNQKNKKYNGFFPAKSPFTISVGSCNEDQIISDFTFRFPNLDICCPGENILSTSLSEKGNYAKDTGTSFAAPFIAGLACLFFKSNINVSTEGFRELLLKNSDQKLINNFSYRIFNPKSQLL